MDTAKSRGKAFRPVSIICFAALLGLMGILAADPSPAIDPGTASGQLSVGEVAIALKHASVMRYGNEEGILERAELRILLTDRELPESILRGPFMQALERLARQGKVRGILLRLDAKKLTAGAVHGTLLLPPGDAPLSLPTFTITQKGGGFEKFQMGNNRVMGVTRWKFSPGPLPQADYIVTFDAPFFQDEVTASLHGRRALHSPQAKVFLDFEEALRRGDLEAARGFCTNDRFAELVAMRHETGEKAFLEAIAAGIPDRRAREKQIRAVYARGPGAIIVLDRGLERSFMAVVNVEGAWRVD